MNMIMIMQSFGHEFDHDYAIMWSCSPVYTTLDTLDVSKAKHLDS